MTTEPLVQGSGTFGAIACPPALLSRFKAHQAQRIALYHYGPDRLCQWYPCDQDVNSSPFQIAYVRNYDNNMDRHFGQSEHSYSHWLWLSIKPGVYKLWTLCKDHPGAAVPAARNEAPLRLVSWLSFRLSAQCQQFIIQEAMDAICSPRHDADFVAMGQQAFPSSVKLTSCDDLRNLLLTKVSLAGMVDPPASVRELFETFLRQLTLPRLIHFFDLVLPQLVPRWEASAGQARSRLECHILRLREDAWQHGPTVPVSRRHLSHSSALGRE